MKTRPRRIGLILSQTRGNRFLIHTDTEKWITDAGIEIVPIIPTIGKDEAIFIFSCIHGLYLQPGEPGNFSNLDNTIRMGALFLTMAIESNKAGHYFPVWGTCMGLQQIVSQIEDVSIHSLNSVESTNHRSPLTIVYPQSRLLQSRSKSQSLHPWFNNTFGIHTHQIQDSILRVVATVCDKKGNEFVAIVEGKTFPIYGVQFHQEKDSKFKWMSTFLRQELMKNEDEDEDKDESKCHRIPRTSTHFMK